MTWKNKQYDLVGQQFGRLVVINKDIEKTNKHDVYWICKCNCGNVKSVTTGHLRSGTVRSCGCIRKEQSIERFKQAAKGNIRHGEAGKTKLYSIWHNMLQRCNNPNGRAYKWYGGKGVKVYRDWYDYKKFADWAYSHGYIEQENVNRSERLSIDRIDSNKDYCPQNCRWISVKENVSRASKAMWKRYETKDR